MPIIIDKDNPLKDITSINKKSTIDKHSPKFFSNKLTGKGKKTGLIDDSVVKLSDQLTKHGTTLMSEPYLTGRVLDDIIKETMYIGSYSGVPNKAGEPSPMYRSKEEHENYYNQSMNDIQIEDTIPLETINPLLINDFTFDMPLPLDTVLWDLNNVEEWGVIDESADKVLRGKVLFSHMTLFHRENKLLNGKKHDYPFLLSPFLMLSVSNKNETATHLTINENNHTDAEAHRVRIVPLRISSTLSKKSKGVEALNYDFGKPTKAFLDIQALESINDFTAQHTLYGDNHPDPTDLSEAILTYVEETNIYDTLTEQAGRYKDHSMNQFVRIVTELKNMYGNSQQQAPHSAHHDLLASMYSLINQLDHIEKQGGKINTEDLNEVYKMINAMTLITEQDKTNITKQSLRLLLAHRLHALNKAKTNNELYDFNPALDKITENVANSTMYSKQQKEIILTQEPLVIGQAGAGSGKSHTVTGRIHYLQAQKENLDGVMVLSFTNVAAQNISNRFPGIKSKTLADMFHSIYKETFPMQHLSTPGTLLNSLTLLNPHSSYFTGQRGHNGDEVADTIRRLKDILGRFAMKFGNKNNDVQNNMRLLMNLVDEKTHIIVDVLDATEQTTLEIEPIIIHNYLNTRPAELTIPDEFKHLNMIITDESQDISTFEYIMLIDMALHFGCQLLIVGDGSQTLYEFRNSDPRYLNTLEVSGVFATYKLETNYRSNPEILTFANQFLKVIEANDVAKIQLQANQLQPATQQSFQDKITVYSAQPMDPDRKGRTDILEDHMLYNDDFREWFYDRIDEGEQIAFLAHTRRDVTKAEAALNQLLDDHGVDEEALNIVSKRVYEKKYISDVLIAIRDDFTKLDAGSPTFVADAHNLIDENNPAVRSCFGHNIPTKILGFNIQDIKDTLMKIINLPMTQAMRKEVANGQRTSYDVMSHILQAMLREETRQNNMQHVLEPKKELDLSKNQVIVSTIHAAKGLEFDHTIVAYHEKSSGSNVDNDKMQETLRMLFVACSRAKDSQWIINTQLTAPTSISHHTSAMYMTPMTTAYFKGVDEIKENAKSNAI